MKNIILGLTSYGYTKLADHLKRIIGSTEKILWENKWLQVIELDNWYTISRQRYRNGVCVLVYDLEHSKVVIRYENNPAHGGFTQTSLTGMMDKEGESPRETAARETLEEAGMEIDSKDLIDLGQVYPDKGSDKIMFLFAYDGHGKKTGKAEGDGTRGEEGSYSEWQGIENLYKVKEPLMLHCIAKLAMQGINLF